MICLMFPIKPLLEPNVGTRVKLRGRRGHRNHKAILERRLEQLKGKLEKFLTIFITVRTEQAGLLIQFCTMLEHRERGLRWRHQRA